MKANNDFFQTKQNKMTSLLEETGAFLPPPTRYSRSFSQSERERKSRVYTGLQLRVGELAVGSFWKKLQY